MTALLMAGLAVFCVVFAVNSSIHSYLIVRYSGGDKVASSVGAQTPDKALSSALHP